MDPDCGGPRSVRQEHVGDDTDQLDIAAHHECSEGAGQGTAEQPYHAMPGHRRPGASGDERKAKTNREPVTVPPQQAHCRIRSICAFNWRETWIRHATMVVPYAMPVKSLEARDDRASSTEPPTHMRQDAAGMDKACAAG